MKRTLTLALAAITVLGLAACGPKPQSTITKLNDALHSDHPSDASHYFYVSGKDSPNAGTFDFGDAKTEAEMAPLLAKVKLEPQKSSVHDSIATVTVKVTGYDMKTAIQDVMAKALPLAFMGQQPSEQQMITWLVNDNPPPLHGTVDVSMVNKDGTWLIAEHNDALFNAMFNSDSVNKAFNGLTNN